MTLSERVKRIQDEIRGVAAQFGVGSADQRFLSSIAGQQFPLSSKQEKWLADIELKVFGEEEE